MHLTKPEIFFTETVVTQRNHLAIVLQFDLLVILRTLWQPRGPTRFGIVLRVLGIYMNLVRNLGITAESVLHEES